MPTWPPFWRFWEGKEGSPDFQRGGCQNYGPFLDPYYDTAPNSGYPKRDHNFDNQPYRDHDFSLLLAGSHGQRRYYDKSMQHVVSATSFTIVLHKSGWAGKKAR